MPDENQHNTDPTKTASKLANVSRQIFNGLQKFLQFISKLLAVIAATVIITLWIPLALLIFIPLGRLTQVLQSIGHAARYGIKPGERRAFFFKLFFMDFLMFSLLVLLGMPVLIIRGVIRHDLRTVLSRKPASERAWREGNLIALTQELFSAQESKGDMASRYLKQQEILTPFPNAGYFCASMLLFTSSALTLTLIASGVLIPSSILPMMGLSAVLPLITGLSTLGLAAYAAGAVFLAGFLLVTLGLWVSGCCAGEKPVVMQKNLEPKHDDQYYRLRTLASPYGLDPDKVSSDCIEQEPDHWMTIDSVSVNTSKDQPTQAAHSEDKTPEKLDVTSPLEFNDNPNSPAIFKHPS